MSQICAELKKPVYGVLGNHDTLCMVRGLEMGLRMLLNEYERICAMVSAYILLE